MLMHRLMAYLVTDVLRDTYGVGNYSFGDDCGTASGRRTLFMDSSTRDFILVGIISTWRYGVYPPVANVVFTQDDVVSLTINEQSAGNGFVLGSAISAAYKLTIDKEVVSELTVDQINKAWVACAVGIKGKKNNADHYYFAPFGVWRVTKSYSAEHDPSIELDGYDYLGAVDEEIYPWWGGSSPDDDEGDGEESGGIIIDQLPLGTISNQLNRFTSTGNESDYYGGGVINSGSGYALTSMPIWSIYSNSHALNSVLNYDIVENETLFIDIVDNDYNSRDLFALTAAALGCFVHINRAGVVEFKPYDYVISPSEYYLSLTPDHYFSYTPNVTIPFDLVCMQITYITSQSGSEYLLKNYYHDLGATVSMFNTLQISANPLVTESVADSINSVMGSNTRQLTSEDATVTFVGTPFVEMGDHVHLTDTSNVGHDFTVNSMETVYNGGLHMTIACNLPSEADGNNISFDPNLSSVAGGSGGGGGSVPINYSTEETYTGVHWIDGKPIFRYVTVETGVTAYNGAVVSLGYLPSLPDTVISVRGMTVTPSASPNYWRPIPFAHTTTGFVAAIWVQNSNGDIRAIFGGANTWNASKTVVAIIEYTKDTGEEVELDI